MSGIRLQLGDKVVITNNTGSSGELDVFLQSNPPVLVVQRAMPYEPDRYECSDGQIHAESELHLVERPASVETELENISQPGRPDHHVGQRLKLSED